MRYESMPRARGFTLVELLVAILILAMLAVISWRGLDTIVRGRTALTENMDQFYGLHLTFSQLQSDCSQAVSSSDFPAHPALVSNGSGITLLRSADTDGGPQQFIVVRYRFADGQLRRAASKPSRDLQVLDQLWADALADRDQGVSTPLQGGLDAVAIRVVQDPPIALEVALRLKGHNGEITKMLLVGAM